MEFTKTESKRKWILLPLPTGRGFVLSKEGTLMKQLQFLETLEKLMIKYYNRQLIYDKDEGEWCH